MGVCSGAASDQLRRLPSLVGPGSQPSGSRVAKIQTSCAAVVAPTFDRAFAMWCFTEE